MLTQRKVERARPGRYGDGHGLYLVVHNANNKSYVFRYERDGRERWMGLGPIHTRPAAMTARAKSAFSARNPYPGCTASAPERRATPRIFSIDR